MRCGKSGGVHGSTLLLRVCLFACHSWAGCVLVDAQMRAACAEAVFL